MNIMHNSHVYKVFSELSGNTLNVEIEGVNTVHKLSKIGNTQYKIGLNDRIATASIIADKDYIFVAIDGNHYAFKNISDQHTEYHSETGNAHTSQVLLPPMPGTVVKVLVEVGDSVHSGSPLLIMEAMKMETTLYSNIDGVVTKVKVNSGVQVSADQELIIIEAPNH